MMKDVANSCLAYCKVYFMKIQNKINVWDICCSFFCKSVSVSV